MTEIIRRDDYASGGITPEEKEKLKVHTQMWIERAMRTDPIEPDKIIPALKGLYRVAGLKEPRVVVVPSPLIMAFVYGAAASILEKSKGKLPDLPYIENPTSIKDVMQNAVREAIGLSDAVQ